MTFAAADAPLSLAQIARHAGVDRSAALLGDGDRDALLGDGLDEGGGRTGVQTDLGSDGGGDLGHVKLLMTCGG